MRGVGPTGRVPQRRAAAPPVTRGLTGAALAAGAGAGGQPSTQGQHLAVDLVPALCAEHPVVASSIQVRGKRAAGPHSFTRAGSARDRRSPRSRLTRWLSRRAAGRSAARRCGARPRRGRGPGRRRACSRESGRICSSASCSDAQPRDGTQPARGGDQPCAVECPQDAQTAFVADRSGGVQREVAGLASGLHTSAPRAAQQLPRPATCRRATVALMLNAQNVKGEGHFCPGRARKPPAGSRSRPVRGGLSVTASSRA